MKSNADLSLDSVLSWLKVGVRKGGKIGTDPIFAVCFFKGLPDLTLDNLHGCQNLGDHGLADALDLKNIFLPCGEQTCQAAEAFKHFPAKLNGGLAFSSCAQ